MFDTGYPSVRPDKTVPRCPSPTIEGAVHNFCLLPGVFEHQKIIPGIQRVDDKPLNFGEIPPILDQMAINGLWQSWIIWTPDMGYLHSTNFKQIWLSWNPPGEEFGRRCFGDSPRESLVLPSGDLSAMQKKLFLSLSKNCLSKDIMDHVPFEYQIGTVYTVSVLF